MDVQATLSISRFYEIFDMEQARVIDAETQEQLELALAKLRLNKLPTLSPDPILTF